MKALLKFVAIISVAVVLVGCGHLGAITGGAVGAHVGGVGGAAVGAGVGSIIDEHGRMHHGRVMPAGRYAGGYGSGNRPHPCQPVNADGLMAWAQGAGGGQNVRHERQASVSNYDGHISCQSSESASSGTTGRNYVQQYQPQYAPQHYGPQPYYGR